MKKKKKIKVFKAAVSDAINFFGLHNFRFYVFEQDQPLARASNYYHDIESSPDTDGRQFSIAYSKHWIGSKDTNREDLVRTAWHEVFECYFYRLRDYSLNTSYVVPKRDVDAEIHRVVRMFENRILPLILSSSDAVRWSR